MMRYSSQDRSSSCAWVKGSDGLALVIVGDASYRVRGVDVPAVPLRIIRIPHLTAYVLGLLDDKPAQVFCS